MTVCTHLTHIKNLESILKKGLYPRNQLIEKAVRFTSFAEKRYFQLSKNIKIPMEKDRKTLDDLIHFYLYKKPPFQYKLRKKEDQFIILIFRVERLIADNTSYLISIGNPLNRNSMYLRGINSEEVQKHLISSHTRLNKKRMPEVENSEVLIDRSIGYWEIDKIITNCKDNLRNIENILKRLKLYIPVEINGSYFFTDNY